MARAFLTTKEQLMKHHITSPFLTLQKTPYQSNSIQDITDLRADLDLEQSVQP